MKVPKVTVREKPIKGDKISLYLDYYPPVSVDGKRGRRETLGLTLFAKPRNQRERDLNKDAKMQADFRRTERQKELNANPNANLITGKDKSDFVIFYRKICEEKQTALKHAKNWFASLGYFELFTGGNLLFNDLTSELAENYKTFLLKCNAFDAAVKKGNYTRTNFDAKQLSPNSAKLYFQFFGSVVRQAVKKKRLLSNPLDDVEKIAGVKSFKEFLTVPELKLLANTKTDIPDNVRRAALFSGLTGLRFSDVEQLKWADVRRDGEEYFLVLRIQKTGEPITHYVSQEAIEFLGARQADETQVFEGLKYSSKINQQLNEWTKAAGINRKIGFHTFRHSFASAHLREGTPIEVISELLSHANIKTTQIYLHSLGERKRKVAGVVSLK